MPEDRLAKVKVRDIDQLIIENPSVIDENSSLIDLLREIIKDYE